MQRNIAFAALIVILAVVNWSIYKKERHISEGRVVYLELAPIDPRSLMQGDYMALRFHLANRVHDSLPKKQAPDRWRHEVQAGDGKAVVRLDDLKRGSFSRIHNEQPLAEDEILMRYRVRNGEVKFATNAFFFQEGHAEYYQPARYGQFRVDDAGELLLVAMHDKDLNKLGPEKLRQ